MPRRKESTMKALLTTTMVLAAIPMSQAVAEEYICDDNTRLDATFVVPKQGLGSVELIFLKSNERISLPQVISADGARYAGGVTEFWAKGSQATLRQAGNVTTCKR
jgi:membrane-bound inhibitor of C-type lysozyme